jgi:sulfite reductase (ferredoxin)
VLLYFKQARQAGESFGDFCNRMGTEELLRYEQAYEAELAAT